MGGFIAMPTVGSCVPVLTLAGGSGPIAISKPVGQGGLARNLPDDVRTIQDALNQVTVKGRPGGPMPFLVVDGIKGPKTQAAILNFQQRSGEVDPRRRAGRARREDDPAPERDRRAGLEVRPERQARDRACRSCGRRSPPRFSNLTVSHHQRTRFAGARGGRRGPAQPAFQAEHARRLGSGRGRVNLFETYSGDGAAW